MEYLQQEKRSTCDTPPEQVAPPEAPKPAMPPLIPLSLVGPSCASETGHRPATPRKKLVNNTWMRMSPRGSNLPAEQVSPTWVPLSSCAYNCHAMFSLSPECPKGTEGADKHVLSTPSQTPPPARPARPRLSLLRPSRTETGHNPPSMVPSRTQPHPGSQHNRHGGSGSFDEEEPACQARPRQTRHRLPTPSCTTSRKNTIHNAVQPSPCNPLALAHAEERKKHAAAGTKHAHSLC